MEAVKNIYTTEGVIQKLVKIMAARGPALKILQIHHYHLLGITWVADLLGTSRKLSGRNGEDYLYDC